MCLRYFPIFAIPSEYFPIFAPFMLLFCCSKLAISSLILYLCSRKSNSFGHGKDKEI